MLTPKQCQKNRKKFSITQLKLSARADVSIVTLRSFERGMNVRPSVRHRIDKAMFEIVSEIAQSREQ